jgi:hypothetical protein
MIKVEAHIPCGHCIRDGNPCLWFMKIEMVKNKVTRILNL